jgi:glutamine synthetase
MSVSREDFSVGKAGFVAEHGLFDEEQQAAVKEVIDRLDGSDLKHVRVSWADQHGIARGKTLAKADFIRALRNGQDFQSATLIMDTSNNIFVPLFVPGSGFGIPELTGYPDVILVPDPTTFRVLPWAGRTGWCLSDMYFSNGKPVPFCSRQLLGARLGELAEAGYDYVAGLEVEFYITKLVDPKLRIEESGRPPDPPSVAAVAHGYQYLTENRSDEIDDILQILSDHLEELGLPLRTIEDEWGPGQVEITFDPQTGLDAANTMILFRNTVKQVCRRNGHHATFMTRPALKDFFSSGWHLHQSLERRADGVNAFTESAGSTWPVSQVARHFAAGLMAHAREASLFATPTITGYKRFAPHSFAPDRAGWAHENRGAMLRVMGDPGDPASHLENRAGEPCANPYLFMASQITAGLDGLARGLDPGELDSEPYSADRQPLPANLLEAVEALDGSKLFRQAWGDSIVDYLVQLKRFEWGRFMSHVTDWEQNEYFEVY